MDTKKKSIQSWVCSDNKDIPQAMKKYRAGEHD